MLDTLHCRFDPNIVAHPYLQKTDLFDGLRYLLIGGEALTPKLIHQLVAQDKRPNFILNGYGPTESTTFTTTYLCGEFSDSVPLGRPINTRKVYVLDPQGQPVPINAPGELHIGGAGLARGYLNRPELTAEKFIDNPFASESDKAKGYTRLYKTGDLVRWLSDGNLEFLGRNDNQVKIRGYRIELGEIESALNQLETIQQAVVIARDKDGQTFLAAYFVSACEIDVDALNEALSQRLPEYMVPSYFTRIDTIPLTINGKLDVKALPEPELINRDNYTAPRNEQETALCEIWQRVLGLAQVGIHDNFFRIGGSSISAIKLTAESRRSLNIDIPLAVLFAYKTIAGITTQLTQQSPLTIPQTSLSHPPLSFAQERLLFIEDFEGGSDAYHIPELMELNSDVDLAVLEAAFNIGINHHPALKTVYREDEHNNVYQHVLTSEISLVVERLKDKETFITSLKATLARPFDLTEEPSIRLNVYYVGDRHYLLILIHHIAFDGWSVAIFMRTLADAYQALSQGHPVALAAQDIHYIDYAAWQREYLQGDILAHLMDYWKTQLSDYETLVLPTDHVRPNQLNYEGKAFTFELDGLLSNQLRGLAQEQETTLYTVLLSGFYVTLANLSGQSDLLIGTPSDNRHHAQTQKLVGFFVNTLALRARLDLKDSLSDFVTQIHQMVSQAKVHQELPFEMLVDALAVERDTSRHPLYQVIFSVQSFEESELTKAGLPFTRVNLNEPESLYSPAKFDLELLLDDSQPALTGSISYAVSLFDASSIERIVEMYRRVLKAFVENPTQRVGDVDCLSEQERHRLLHTWNETDAPYPQDKTLSELFEAQVKQTPDNVALVFEDESLTYQQLNRRANQLALAIRERYERSQGEALKADTLIALYFDRSLDMVISILAVLKAGGAYVPISPEHPKARVLFILEDTQAPLLLTQSQHLRLLTEWTSELESSLVLLDSQEDFRNYPVTNVERIHQATNLAYVIYTSGTTGQPKGVMIEQRSVINLLLFMVKTHRLKAETHALLSSNYVFDASVYELFPSLSVGATLFIVAKKLFSDPLSLLLFINSNDITKAFIPTSLLNQISEELTGSTLQVVHTGGDKLSKLAALPAPLTYNEYGPTEGTVCVTQHELRAKGDLVIGRPIDNTRCYILDRQGKPAPVNTRGELHIGGAGLARGYLNRPTLTAEKFVANPFATEADKVKGYTRLYKTGDLVRWLPDGNLEFIGRNDNQVKIRGFRIELGEIESILSQITIVKRAVVTAITKNDTDYIIAYVVSDSIVDFASLRQRLSNFLPDYMIPTTFSQIDFVPLNTSGKIDKELLPKPLFNSFSDYLAPRSKLEKKLVHIWEKLLGHNRVGINDDFYQLGGNSILLVKLKSMLRKQLDMTPTLMELFEYKTIEQFSRSLSIGKGKKKKFLHQLTPVNKSAKFAVVCAPFAGGDGLIFEEFSKKMTKDVALYAIEFPRDYKALSSDEKDRDIVLKNFMKTIVLEIEEKIDLPIFIFGYCGGTTVAVLLAHMLLECGHDVRAIFAGVLLLDKDDFLKAQEVEPSPMLCSSEDVADILDFVGFSLEENVPEDERSTFIQNTQRDIMTFAWCLSEFSGYHPRKLSIPLYNIIAKDDPATKNHKELWKTWQLVSDKCELIELNSGGHFVMKTVPEVVAEKLENICEILV